MAEQKTGIVAECVCDLSESTCRRYGVDTIDFLIETDTGVFTDTKEITTTNLLEYMQDGGQKSHSQAPPVSVYRETFERSLEKYDEIIFIAISAKISESVETAEAAAQQMGADGKRVHVFDSESLSTGIGHMVVRAAKMAKDGAGAAEILAMLQDVRPRVVTTFIVPKTDYMYQKGLISQRMHRLCATLGIRPVLLMRDGQIVLKQVFFGRYDKAARAYLRSLLKKCGKIDRSLAFLTHVGCSVEDIGRIRREVGMWCRFDELEVTKASATISSNCGPGTFGVLYVKQS